MVQKRDNRLDCLDGLKGVGACIIAFAWHYVHFGSDNGFPFHDLIPWCFDYGYLMTEIFFMLSGFGMMMGYSNRIIEHEVSFLKFMSRRISKIYPLFLLTTIIIAIMQISFTNLTGSTFVYRNFDLYHLILNMSFLQAGLFETDFSFNGPAWFLSVIMLMYVIFYFVCYRCKNHHYTYFVYAALLVVGMSILQLNSNGIVFNNLVGGGMASFSMGCLLYAVFNNLGGYSIPEESDGFVLCQSSLHI